MLVFSLRRGESFYVGDQRVQLVDFDGEAATLKTEGARFRCPNQPIELPGQVDVQVSAGLRQEQAIRIGIKAPLDIKILRERLYRRAQAELMPDRPTRPNRHFAKAINCTACRGIMRIQMSDGVWVKCPAAQDPNLPICEEVG